MAFAIAYRQVLDEWPVIGCCHGVVTGLDKVALWERDHRIMSWILAVSAEGGQYGRVERVDRHPLLSRGCHGLGTVGLWEPGRRGVSRVPMVMTAGVATVRAPVAITSGMSGSV